MSDVATDAYREILSRVPAESLPDLRRVCKAWRRIIDDPAFFEELDGGERLILCFQSGGGLSKLFSVSLSSLNHSGQSTKTVYATNVKHLIRRGVPPVKDVPLPSCHGLILLSHYEIKRIWTIWNPFTKAFVELPRYDHLAWGTMRPCGAIGYDVVSGDYKVVRVSGDITDYAMETLIYSLKSKTWRRIQDYPNCVLRFGCESGLYLKGAIYFFAMVKQNGGGEVHRIMALDLGTERYRQLRMPPSYCKSEYPLDTYLDAFGGCLFVSYSYEERFDIWMMNDHGGAITWKKFVSLDRMYNVGIFLINPRLISYSKSKKEVVIRNEDYLLWYNVEKKCGTRVSIQGIGFNLSCQAFPLSLVRLNGIGHGNETNALSGTLKRKRTTTSDRLALKLKASRFSLMSHDDE